MKILAIADEESRSLWDYFTKDKVEAVDLIISCGDLDPKYLEFLVTMTNCPLLYVNGNHDRKYLENPPEGCICIENRVYDYKGLRVLGLGGSMRYRPDAPFMYTESEMSSRISKVNREITLRNGFDILVSHAPAKGFGDMDDLPHQGFECFNRLLDKYHPAYMIHGHVHKTYLPGSFEREIRHPSGTRIINAFQSCMLEIGKDEYPAVGKTGSFLYDFVMTLKQKRGPKY